MASKTYRCGCGMWMGEPCDWRGPLSRMVVVEYMPESWRESHTAAGGPGGAYPDNGAERVATCRQCAKDLVEREDDADWARITRHNPADYVEQDAEV